MYDGLKGEIRSAFIKYEDIRATEASRLKYLRAVIQEGLRIYPPLPLGLPRVVPEGGDTVDGHLLPAGVSLTRKRQRHTERESCQTVVSTNPIAASLSSSNFDDPFEFRPYRWQNGQDMLEASQPFSLGPRGCLGRR